MSRTITAKSDLTRQRILGAAAREFRAHGIGQGGLRDIMEQAGLTRDGFYFHFEDKDALVREAIGNAAMDSAEENVQQAEPVPPGSQLRSCSVNRDRPAQNQLAGKSRPTLFSSAWRACFRSGVGAGQRRYTCRKSAITLLSLDDSWVPRRLPGLA